METLMAFELFTHFLIAFILSCNHYLPNPQIIDQLQNQQPRNVHNFTYYYYYYPQKTLFTKTENVMIYFNKLTD